MEAEEHSNEHYLWTLLVNVHLFAASLLYEMTVASQFLNFVSKDSDYKVNMTRK